MHLERKKHSEFRRFLTLFLAIGVPIIIAWVFYFEPQPSVEQHEFFEHENEGPLVISHRAGDLIAPGNTMTAIQMSHDLGVDIVEVDIHITADGELVLLHDPTVDRTTDGEGAIIDFTLEEFLNLDAGYTFEDQEGEFSFRNIGIYKPTVREMFEEFPDMKYMLEVKDTNPEMYYEEIVDRLWELIVEYDMIDNVMMSSFDQNLIRMFNERAEGQIALGSGRETAFNFVMTHKFFARNFFEPTGQVMQLPKENRYFNFFEDRIINGAHRRGMGIHYWTINDEQTMREMIDADVDGIITDRPDLLIEILQEKGMR
ncbi:glycerophosphodiester phosphodiesterase [Halalkalibacillus halophilus]|uniref:glycerophosphodiester phosphodiesterase n=1 Tax=Halalkalibacillus halophilus TaxID=392827 RepID=UPI000403390A|nr:glycerophosphodiester phosphodiesterase [Halalkalibacillus halophilus]